MKVAEFTEYIAPDGVTYKFDAGDRFLISEEGLGLPPVEYITQKGPFQHGENLVDYRLGVRTIQLLLRQDTCSRFDYWTSRASLLNMVRPNRYVGSDFGPGTLRKKLPDGTIRDIDVIIEQGPIFSARSLDHWDEFGFTETLRFLAHNPTFYDPEQRSVQWETLVDATTEDYLIFGTTSFSFVFPFVLGVTTFVSEKTVAYPGTWHSYPRITVLGPQEDFKITNVSTGEFIQLDYNIAAGEEVTIDLPFGNKTVENNVGTSLIGTVTPTSNLATFHIAPDPEVPGGVNVFRVDSVGTSAASKVLMEYYIRYIGI